MGIKYMGIAIWSILNSCDIYKFIIGYTKLATLKDYINSFLIAGSLAVTPGNGFSGIRDL
jgi:hypothetical protein